MAGKMTYEDLMCRVKDLEEEVTRQNRFQGISQTLFKISKATKVSASLDELYASIHEALGLIIDVSNFFIALYDKSKDGVSFPFFIDSVDACYPDVNEISKTESLTAEVIRTRRPLLITGDEVLKRTKQTDRTVANCTPSAVWLGVPLKVRNKIIGVMAVQSYTDDDRFDHIDMAVMESVADQLALAIDRKQTETVLESQNRMMSSLLDNLEVGVFMIEAPSGKPLIANRRAKELIGRGIMNGADRSTLAEVYQAYKSETNRLYPLDELPIVRGLNGETTSVDDMIVVHPDNSRVSLEVFGSPIKNSKGEITGSIASFADITERKRAEEALKKSEKQLKVILEANPNPVVVYDTKGCTQYLNLAFTETFGWSLEELKGKRIPYVPENQREPTTRAIEKVYRHGKAWRIQSQRMKKNGEILDVIISAAVIEKSEDKISGLIVNITDISQQKKLEAQLQQAQKMESIGRLAGGIAHDFNNMLSIITGNTEMALEDINADDPVVTNLQEIYKAARRSSDLTRQLLAFARKQVIAPRILDLNKTIDRILAMLRRLIGEDIGLKWVPQSELGLVRLDPSQIDQILTNICLNARDSITGAGKITIETGNVTFDKSYCRTHKGFRPGEYVMLAVSDNGCGMDRATIENLFEPFFTTKDFGKGTGLGLATVYGIVKQNQGFINVYSELGEGTTFKIYLPRHENAAEKIPEKASNTVGRGHETILLVEDEQAIMTMTRSLLERLGYNVIATTSPADAIRIGESRSTDIHLLITDVVMPEMSGKELAQILLRSYPGLKCLYMSGYTAEVIAHHGILEKGLQFINKPFTSQKLALKIRRVLDESGDRPAIAKDKTPV